MISLEDAIRSKVDYRIVEVARSSPSTEVKAIVLTNVPPSEDVVNDVSSSAKVNKVYNFMSVIKIEGKAKDVASLAQKEYVKYIMLEEIVINTLTEY